MANTATRPNRKSRRERLVIKADEERADAGVEVHIGGKVYIGLEPTIEQMRDIADLLPELSDEDADAPATPERVKENLDTLYPQLQALLREQVMSEVDPHGGPGQEAQPTGEMGDEPSQEILEKHLSVRQAARILNALTASDPN